MVDLLSGLTVSGKIFMTARFQKVIIQTPEYIEQRHHTQWLGSAECDVAGLIDAFDNQHSRSNAEIAVIGSVILAYKKLSDNWKIFDKMVASGHSPDDSLLKMRLEEQILFRSVQYDMVFWCAPGSKKLMVEIGGKTYVMGIFVRTETGIYVTVKGHIYHVQMVQENADGTMVNLNNNLYWFPTHQDPTVCRTQTGGRLVRFLDESGANLEEGDHFAEIEIMKTILKLSTKIAGKLTHAATEGQSLDPGQIIATIEPRAAEGEESSTILTFEGELPFPVATDDDTGSVRVLWRKKVSTIPRSTSAAGGTVAKGKITDKRIACLRMNTTYVFDLFAMFQPKEECELIVNQETMEVSEGAPKFGDNSCGMVGRRMVLQSGQEIIVVANDIT